MATNHRTWTPEQDKQLLRMYEAGTAKNAIARALGRPNSSIRSRLLTLGIIDGAVGEVQPLRGARLAPPKIFEPRPVEKKRRPCLRCRQEFLSAGSHNRLCSRCASRSVSPYAP